MNVSLGQIKFKVVNTSNLDNNIKQIILFVTTLLLIKSYSKGTVHRAIIFLNPQVVNTDFGACMLRKSTKIVEFG